MWNLIKKVKYKNTRNTEENNTYFYKLEDGRYNVCGSIKRLSQQELLTNFNWLGDSHLDGMYNLVSKVQSSRNKNKCIYIFGLEDKGTFNITTYREIVCFVCGNVIKVCDMFYLHNYLSSFGKNFNRFTRFLRDIGYVANEQSGVIKEIISENTAFGTVIIDGAIYLTLCFSSMDSLGNTSINLTDLYEIEHIEGMLLVSSKSKYSYVNSIGEEEFNGITLYSENNKYKVQLFTNDVEYVLLVRNIDTMEVKVYSTGIYLTDNIDYFEVDSVDSCLVLGYSNGGEFVVDLLDLMKLADTINTNNNNTNSSEVTSKDNTTDNIDISKDIIEYKIKLIKNNIDEIEKLLKD